MPKALVLNTNIQGLFSEMLALFIRYIASDEGGHIEGTTLTYPYSMVISLNFECNFEIVFFDISIIIPRCW